jgi:hypothetical protein
MRKHEAVRSAPIDVEPAAGNELCGRRARQFNGRRSVPVTMEDERRDLDPRHLGPEVLHDHGTGAGERDQNRGLQQIGAPAHHRGRRLGDEERGEVVGDPFRVVACPLNGMAIVLGEKARWNGALRPYAGANGWSTRIRPPSSTIRNSSPLASTVPVSARSISQRNVRTSPRRRALGAVR